MYIVELNKALADPTRIRLLNILLPFELNVGELVELFQMGQSRISRHLKILSGCGLIRSRRDGQWTFYSAEHNQRLQPFLAGVHSLLAQEVELEQDKIRATEIIKQRTRRTQAFFESLAEQCPQTSRQALGHLDLSEEILARVPMGSVVADLGCGTGDMLLKLSTTASTVIGVDNSANMLAVAARNIPAKSGISLRIGEIDYLPLRDDEADVVILSMVLHHLASPQAALLETSRILKPGGKIIIADFMQHEKEDMRREYRDLWLGFLPKQVKTWLKQAGFTPKSEKKLPGDGIDVLLLEAEKNNSNQRKNNDTRT